jgi:hypothetical protein
MPVQSQTSSPSETAWRLNPRMLNEYRGPAPRGDVIANPSTPTRPPRAGNTASPTTSPRPSPTVASPIPIKVELKPAKETVQIGGQVKFTATLSPPLREAIYMFYQDGSLIDEGRDKNEAVAQFSTPGSYVVTVQVRVRGIEVRDSAAVQVQVPPRSSPTPTSTAMSAPITPSPSPYSPSPTATVLGGSITATPSGSGSNVASHTATRSPLRHHTATPTPTPSNGGSAWWIFYVVSAGLAVAALAFLIFPRTKPKIPMAARPTFHPHADWDAPQRSPQNVAINYGFYFHSNVSAGQDRLQTDGARLILRRRTQ